MGQHRPQYSEIDETEDWLKVLDRLPFVGSIKRDTTALRNLLYDRRAPRIAVVGAPGSGRTALANGLLNAMTFGPGGAAPSPEAGAWVRIDADGRKMEWLELPTDLDAPALVELARRAFDESTPDLILGVIEAEAEAREAPPLRETLTALAGCLKSAYDATPPTLVVLSKVDALPPGGEAPPYSEGKRHGIDLALEALREHLGGLGLAEEAFVPASAKPYADEPHDPRYNLDGLGEAILARLPDPAKVEAVRAFGVGREARRTVARSLVNSCSAIALTVGLAPVPFADAFVLLPLQAAMVTGIAYVSGRSWDRKVAVEYLASLGAVGSAGVGLRWGAQQLVKLIPGAGSLVGASVAGAGTLAIGRSAMAYFIDGPGREERLELRADNPD